MDPKTQLPSDRVYDDFEPYFEWDRDETSVVLIVMLPGFSREQLKIAYTSVLSISGERKISEKKWLRFQKQFTIPSDCDTHKMSARFQYGMLYFKFPLLTRTSTRPREITGKPLADVEAPRPTVMASVQTQKTLQKEGETIPFKAKGEIEYEDYEPRFEWTRDSDGTRATLLVMLPGFRKEHLKDIQVTTSVLTINGERQINENKWLRFSEQFSIPSDCDTNKMRAMFEDGVLHVMFSLLTTSTVPQATTILAPDEATRPMARAPTQKEGKPSHVMSSEASKRTTQKEEEKEKEPVKPELEGALRSGQAKTEPRGTTEAPEAQEEAKTNEVSEKTSQKGKITTETPEEASRSEGQKMMKPQQITKQPDDQEAIPKPRKEEISEISEDITQKEKNPSSTEEEVKEAEDADKIAQKKKTNGVVQREEATSSGIQENQVSKMITRVKTRILEFTPSLRPSEMEYMEAIGELKKPKNLMALMVVILPVVLAIYAQKAFRST